MSEIVMLRLLLVAAMMGAPLITREFLLTASKLHDVTHVVAFLLTVVALFIDWPQLSVVWLLYCLFAFGLFVRESVAQRGRRWTVHQALRLFPFVFSVVGALWLVSGANDFGLLGYGIFFSYYAALHGHVLGWMLIGSMILLATRPTRFQQWYLVAGLVSVVSFFLIAFGIDGVPFIKPAGVTGLTLAIGCAQILFLFEKRSKSATALGLISLLGFSLTLLLAWRHELNLPVGEGLLGVRPMVSLHGFINSVVVAPCMVAAALMDTRSKGHK